MTQDEILKRLKGYLPAGWFHNSSLIDAVLSASANVFLFIYNAFDYLHKQSRIKTCTDNFLDEASKDFLGDFLPRRHEESDQDFRRRLLPSLLPYPPTRQGMIDALTNIIGVAPKVYESFYDGSFLDQTMFVDNGACGFDAPYQGVVVLDPNTQPALNIPTYGVDQNFFIDQTGFVFSLEETINPVWTLEDIMLIINRFKVFGTIIYLNDFTSLKLGPFPEPILN